MKIAFRRTLLRRSLYTLLAALCAASLCLAYAAASIYRYARVDEKTRADAAIVLGAGLQRNAPSPVFKERIHHGVWLYENGYADKLVFTGGRGENSTYSDARVAARYAVSRGVPEEDILLEERSRITRENIAYAAEILRKNGMRNAILVSDPLHMKRAMAVARENGMEAYSSPTPSSRYRTPRTKAAFLLRETFLYVADRIYATTIGVL